MNKLRVATVVGTRPELIRLSRLIPLLDEHTNHRFIHTGQNYDENLKDVFFRDFELREPDVYLSVNNSSAMTAIAEVITGVERDFNSWKPDAVVILGDTNSAIAAFVARRLGIATYHLEAGNRSFDPNVPEEVNRRMVDHVSTFNLPYSEHARRNLLAEGFHPRFISLTGSPMPEVLKHYSNKIEQSDALRRLDVEGGKYLLVSSHRQENVDSIERLSSLVHSINELANNFEEKVVFPVHPRTRLRLSGSRLEISPKVLVCDPMGFFDFVALQKSARCVLSDSGTISEESGILGFPSLTIRDSMERPEALESGVISMVGLGYEEILRGISRVSVRQLNPEIPQEYRVLNFSDRVLGFIESTAPRVSSWVGLRGD